MGTCEVCRVALVLSVCVVGTFVGMLLANATVALLLWLRKGE